MTFTIGTRLGPYDIISLLGEGGMGKVWRARHSALNRDDALKVLPDAFATDPERLARFRREAQVLASLNHPNIAHVHGFEQADGVQAIVMELVEGPTLADRIAQGPIPVDEALAIAKQIAEALEAAHEQGIIHRDLKPANIKLRPDGTVKVLDFGLAKAMESLAGSSPSVSQSPTITSPAMTQMGVILGTAAYMSPEQARGKAVDKRADIWAFGCVLYEMLTGQRAFDGEDVTEALAAVVKSEPAWEPLPGDVPSSVKVFLRRCLQKNANQRLHDIADMRLALQGAFETVESQTTQFPANVLPAWRRALPIVGALVMGALLVGLTALSLWPSLEPPAVSRFDYDLPAGQVFRGSGRQVLALSPDGGHFVFNTTQGLFLRSIGALEARLIPGTEGSSITNPFFSADGKSIGYFDGSQLRRISTSGGASEVICAASSTVFGASWGLDNTILFAHPQGIMRVSANGGTAELVIRADGERIYGPQLLPGEELVLFSVTKGDWTEAQVVVQSLRTQERTVVVPGGSEARYLSTGHLVYALGDSLFAVAFDAKQLSVQGGPVLVVQGVSRSLGNLTGAANYGVSQQGTLVYLPELGSSFASHLTWFDRSGKPQGVAGDRTQNLRNFSLAPDESRVAVASQNRGIWLADLRRNVTSQLVSLGGDPVWSPDGSRVAFGIGQQGEVFSVPAGGGERSVLFQTGDDRQAWVEDWHPDGEHLALILVRGGKDQGVVTGTTRDKSPIVFDESSDLDEPHFSPDGRWIAYNADRDGGGMEVYVVPYPPTGERIQVSAAGGMQARWRPDGREIFYLTADGTLMAVEVKRQEGLVLGVPIPLFDTGLIVAPNIDQYAVTRDGRRFLVSLPADAKEAVPPPQFVIVQNWFEELKRVVPTN
jgi:serine/threonine protein kinase/Tol biopolymer transport system component